MSDYETVIEPEWDSPIGFQIPRAIIECVFWNADAVHTGYDSCIDPKLVIVDTIAHEDNGDNYCRYVEQEYVLKMRRRRKRRGMTGRSSSRSARYLSLRIGGF